MVIRRHLVPLLAVSVALCVAGCGGGDSKEKPAAGPVPHHEHVPPHGGTAVELGHEQFHIELVLDAPSGKLIAYVMDGELEKFVRIAATSFEVVAQVGGKTEPLMFQPVANAATGEKPGDTSQFEASAGWLKSHPVFDAVLPQITVRGTTFKDVRFNFPKGNE